MQLGKIGVWSFLDGMSSAQMAQFAQRIEKSGYGALWVPEAFGRNSLVSSSWLLANTQNLVVATGIANIYARDPMAAIGAQYGLNEQSGGRFLLGLGVSHKPLVSDARGHSYGKPLASMRNYLEAMAKVEYTSPPPPEKPLTVLAALGPKMLQLSSDLADGAHTYNVTPEHTAQARAIIGPGKLLCVEQMLIAESDPTKARAIARTSLAPYLPLPNYANNWRRLGFVDDDLVNGGSDRFIDAIIAWGDDKALAARVQAHFANGADHVCVQLLGESPIPDSATLERLAPVLMG